MWRAVAEFTDSTDNRRRYRPGDAYPREGLEPTPERVAELAGDGNRQGRPLIEEVPERAPRQRRQK